MTYKRTLAGGASRLAAAFLISGLALAACKPAPDAANAAASNAATNDADATNAPAPLAAIALASGPAAPITPAPLATALPAAPPAPVARLANPGDQYAFADRAAAANAGFGDAPPDYAVNYGGGVQPWVWRGDDRSTRVAEPLPGGGFRYYYYEPGATTPYLVRDPTYSYGYAGGSLAVVYDAHGRPVPPGVLSAQAALAGRFLYRAQQLYAASQQQHEAVAQANWQARRAAIDSQREQWRADESANQAWAAYHAAHQQAYDSQWAAERYRREAEAARFAQSVHDTSQAQKDLQAAQEARARAGGPGAPAGPAGRPNYAAPSGAAPISPVARPPTDDRRAAAIATRQAQHDQLVAQKDAARQAKLAERAQIVATRNAAIQSRQTAAEQAKAAKLAARKAALDARAAHTTTPRPVDPKAPKPKRPGETGADDRRAPDHP
jgi:hypothetical protein